MLIEHQHPHNRSIIASVIGAPNVGKSSLINYLLGTDLSIVTHKAQTTRNRFNCVFTVDRTEIILIDTPGFHQSSVEINKRMNEQAREGAEGSDINLMLIDLTKELLPQFENIKAHIKKELNETWVVFTKADKFKDLDEQELFPLVEKAREIHPNIAKYFVLSSKTGDNMHELIGALCDKAPEGPHLYNKGQISNKHVRFFIAEYVRQQVFELLNEELPYEIAVTVDEYEDFRRKPESKIGASIQATIHVNRPSQRAIVVGSKGSMIREIGIRARAKIEELLEAQVGLKLHVKVSQRWFKNNFILEELGLPRAENSNRVWRAK